MSEIEKTMDELAATITAILITYDIDTNSGIGKKVLELFSKLEKQLKDIRNNQ